MRYAYAPVSLHARIKMVETIRVFDMDSFQHCCFRRSQTLLKPSNVFLVLPSLSVSVCDGDPLRSLPDSLAKAKSLLTGSINLTCSKRRGARRNGCERILFILSDRALKSHEETTAHCPKRITRYLSRYVVSPPIELKQCEPIYSYPRPVSIAVIHSP